LLVLVPHNHRYWLEKGDRWEYFWISINGEETLRIHQMVLSTAVPVLKLKPGDRDERLSQLADAGIHDRRAEFGGVGAVDAAEDLGEIVGV
ncbi:AraC family ligand binding domain-containing protein, partial [Rhizobium leguminosarum]|uniref:AraC family ligand binding domain-containing protein n=1 Tax=Rhizobium leguminosarum TaxID=384 RepID=UPI003F973520